MSVSLSLTTEGKVSVGDSSLVDDGEPIDKIGCVVMAPVTVDTVCREWCGNTAAVGLDVLVAGVVAEDDVGNRDSKWV